MRTNFERVLITGCAGFIGSRFAQFLNEKLPHVTIVGIDNFSTGRRDAVPGSVDMHEGDITNLGFLDRIFSKYEPEIVFHFAALPPVMLSIKSPTETTRTNVLGTVALLEKARDFKVKRFVYSSSAAVYGNSKKTLVSEKAEVAPASPYGMQKYTSELFVQQFARLFGLDSVCLRYFNVFGPGQYGESAYATVIARWLEQLYFGTGAPVEMEGDGTQSRDFCFIDNICEANLKAATHTGIFHGDAFNIGTGKRTDLLTLRAMIEKYSGKKLPLIKKSMRVGDIKHSQADIKKATMYLKYRPTVSIDDGLIKTLEWFEARAAGKI